MTGALRLARGDVREAEGVCFFHQMARICHG